MFVRLAGKLPPPVTAQLAMWMVMPIWLTIASSSYFFATGKRAWLFLGGANLLVASLLAAVRLA